jgi:triacylglycerol lipase
MNSMPTTWDDLLRPGSATDFFSRRAFPPFEPQTVAYSRANSLWLAELSRLVYRHDVEEDNPCPRPSRTHFLKRAGLRQHAFFISEKTNTKAMLVEPVAPPAFAVLVFRGTQQSYRDAKTDLVCGILPSGRGEIGVHKGFGAAVDSVWGEIESVLSRLACPLFYTGHSMGAALAVLAAARRAPQAVYTFASPQIGNEAFTASLADVPIYRVVDDQDAVTSLPPRILGFRHVGALQLLKGQEEKRSFWDTFIAFPPKPLADHAPVNYVDRI